jgi:prevent-host-death family protein
MKIASIADVKAKFSSYIKESEDEAVVVTRNGRPVAVLLGVQDDDEVERLILYRSRRLREILEKSKRQIREGDWLGHDEFWQQVEAADAGARRPEAPRPKARARKPRKS